MEIVNGTTHAIVIYRIEDTEPIQAGRKLILKEGAKPVFEIEAGKNLNAVKGNADLPADLLVQLQNRDFPFPIKGGVVFRSYDPVPEADIVVVSNLYRSAVRELGTEEEISRLATVDGVVYLSGEELRPCGCLGLAIG